MSVTVCARAGLSHSTYLHGTLQVRWVADLEVLNDTMSCVVK